jgi:hypothetical protein
MPRVCTVCAHSEREAIDAALLTTETKRGIARRYAIDEDAIGRHAAKHLAQQLRDAADLAEVGRLDVLVADVQRLRLQADRLGKAAEEQGDPRTALAALRESRETMAFLAKLLGLGVKEVLAVEVTADVGHFEPSPEFMARVAQNVRALNLAAPEAPILLEVVKPPEVTEADDLVDDGEVDEYIAETKSVRPHSNGAPPPPSGIGVVKMPGSNPDHDRWNWER